MFVLAIPCAGMMQAEKKQKEEDVEFGRIAIMFESYVWYDVRTIVPEKYCPRLGLRFALGLEIGRNISRGQLSQNSQLHFC